MNDDSGPAVPPGWYPDPEMADTQRYWDGRQWTGNVAPQNSSNGGSSQLAIGIALAAAVGGFILSQQSVSLISGSGIVWTGTAICIAAGVLCWVVKTIPTWTRVICVLAALAALITAISVESELNERREELSNLIQ